MERPSIRRFATPVAAALGAAIVALLVAHYFWAEGGPFDLAVYRAAGEAVVSGQSPYAADLGRDLGNALPFTYPPLAALLAVPLAMAPIAVDYIAWTLASFAILARFVIVRLRHSELAAKVGIPLLVALACWTTPVTDVLVVGQLGIFITFGCLWSCTSRHPAAAAVVGLLGAVKLTPLAFAAYFALTRQWLRLAWAVGVFAGLTALAWAVLPAASGTYFGHLLWDSSRVGDPAFYANQSWLAVTMRLGLWPSVWVALVVSTLAAGFWLAARWHRSGAPAQAAICVGITTLLVSPISWQHHAVWVVAALVILAPLATSAADRSMLLVTLALALLRMPHWGSLTPAVGGLPLPREAMLDSGTASYVLLLVVLWRLLPPTRGRAPESQRIV